jgi:hypothetical protein
MWTSLASEINIGTLKKEKLIQKEEHTDFLQRQ